MKGRKDPGDWRAPHCLESDGLALLVLKGVVRLPRDLFVAAGLHAVAGPALREGADRRRVAD